MRRLLFATALIILLLAGLIAVLSWGPAATSALPVAPANGHGELMGNLDLAQIETERIGEIIQRMAEDGYRYVRLRIPWDGVQPQPERWQWGKVDTALAAARTNDLSVLALLDGSPAWARAPQDQDNGFAPPHDVRDFGAFAAALATRANGTITAYQIWDEPNIYPHWGHRPAEPQGYFELLREAANSIRSADPAAPILLASLAPTTADEWANRSDLLYLDQLYQLGAGAQFDGIGASAYGFDQPPDATPAPDQLNFRRPELLHEIMARYGDAQKPIWITSWGWWSPQDGLNIEASPWRGVTQGEAANYAQSGLHLARMQWPWAGPLAWAEYAQASMRDPLRAGFALRTTDGEPTAVGAELANQAQSPARLGTGAHTLNDANAHTTAGAWRFSPDAVDPNQPDAELTVEFEGQAVAVEVQRGDYWATLSAWIDGQPAPLLPKDERGNAYIALHDPGNETAIVPLARDLVPGVHTLQLRASAGWGQWLLRCVIVDHHTWPAPRPTIPLVAVLTLGLIAAGWAWLRAWHQPTTRRTLTDLCARALAMVEPWQQPRRWHFPVALALFAALALAPSLPLSLAALAALTLLLALRLDLVPAIVLVTLPFYVRPKLFGPVGVPLHELLIWLGVALWVGWELLAFGAGKATRRAWRLSGLDIPLLLLVFFALAATLNAARPNVAVYELRTVFLTPLAFYWLATRLPTEDKRLIPQLGDGLMLGAALISVVGIAQLLRGQAPVFEGVPRVSALYGSANNLALYLGRALPLMIVLAFGRAGRAEDEARRSRVYRGWVGLALLVSAAAAFLTFSKGLLFIGLPASLLLLALFERRLRWPVLALFALAALAVLPFLGTPRFADVFDTGSGTTFFRLQLWQSAWRMFLDHPWLGVGPDNFLYAYRHTYVLPAAWQELNLSHPHNLLLDLLTRVGLLGFVAGMWLLISTLVRGLRMLRARPDWELRPYVLGLWVGLVAGLLHGQIDNSLFLPDLMILTLLVVAVMQRLSEKSARATIES